jgi:hypothetical protein
MISIMKQSIPNRYESQKEFIDKEIDFQEKWIIFWDDFFLTFKSQKAKFWTQESRPAAC